ncbi:MAG: AmmeMemoRadiSam system radical SAM enzyme [Acidobacteria bacterium]|nr:MAG: AmmeMemoRadiSam system radical SAM enzyme [Acidobacteriota bacterium]
MSAPAIGRWWRREPDGRIVCELCPRRCRLREGQRAFCYVRQATARGIELTTYGRSSGFCIDPIEKKPLNHFLPGTPVLSFGTAGCNLGCRFCQNWDISKARAFDRLQELAPPEAIAEAAAATGCRSVAFTYNDPVIFAEYAIDTARACHARGIRTVAVTAGYISPEARAEFFEVMDAANVDLKAFSDDFYRRYCAARLEPVLDTLRWLVRESRTWIEITTLLIPGANDSDEEIRSLAEFVRDELRPDVPLHFTAFHPDYRLTDRGPTPPETLSRARRIAMDTGLEYVYTGNVHDPEGGSTWCPGCGALLVERDWYRLGRWGIRNGACARCGRRVPGVFEDGPGSWGPRRQPVRLAVR